MRQVFFPFFILLFCLISSCTKENVISINDKIHKIWDVQSSTISFIGHDTVLNSTWTTTDTTFITLNIEDTLVTTIILDSLLNVKPGVADTLVEKLVKFDDDLIQIGSNRYLVKYITTTGMELEYKNAFYDKPPFHAETRNIILKAE